MHLEMTLSKILAHRRLWYFKTTKILQKWLQTWFILLHMVLVWNVRVKSIWTCNRILPQAYILSFLRSLERYAQNINICLFFFLFSFLIPKNPATSAPSLYQGLCRLFHQMTRFIIACPSTQNFQIFHRLFSLLLGSCHPISHWVTKSGLNSRSRWRKTVKEGRTKSEISPQYVELLVIPVFRTVFPFLGHHSVLEQI